MDLTGPKSIEQTIDLYRVGEALEQTGRHYKRLAVAAEYNQCQLEEGRTMEAWYRKVGLTSDAGRQLLGEARKLELDVSTGHSDAPQLSQALPTRHAALEYAKAEPEVKEVIKEIIKEDPNAQISAQKIKQLQQEKEELIADAMRGRKLMAENQQLKEQLDAVTNNESAALQSARQELDLFGQEVMALARQIDSLSTNVFTHNDPSYLAQIQQHLVSLSDGFSRRVPQYDAGAGEYLSGI